MILLSVRVVATGVADKLELRAGAVQAPEMLGSVADSRRVFDGLANEWMEMPLRAAAALSDGSTVVGPAIVEHPLTTINVPEGWSLEVDAHRNYRLRDVAALATAAGGEVAAAAAR